MVVDIFIVAYVPFPKKTTYPRLYSTFSYHYPQMNQITYAQHGINEHAPGGIRHEDENVGIYSRTILQRIKWYLMGSKGVVISACREGLAADIDH